MWEVWLHTTMEKSFKDFKQQQNLKTMRQKQQTKTNSPEREKALLDFASQFVKPTNPQERR